MVVGNYIYLLEQPVSVIKLEKFYGRHYDFVNRYG